MLMSNAAILGENHAPFQPEDYRSCGVTRARCGKSLRFYTQTLGCDIAKRRPDLGLVHLRAGAAMIDLVDVNGQLGKKAATRPILTGKMSITSACASILSTKTSC